MWPKSIKIYLHFQTPRCTRQYAENHSAMTTGGLVMRLIAGWSCYLLIKCQALSIHLWMDRHAHMHNSHFSLVYMYKTPCHTYSQSVKFIAWLCFKRTAVSWSNSSPVLPAIKTNNGLMLPMRILTHLMHSSVIKCLEIKACSILNLRLTSPSTVCDGHIQEVNGLLKLWKWKGKQNNRDCMMTLLIKNVKYLIRM